MNTSIKIIGFTMVLLISIIATVKPEALGFVKIVPYGDKIAHFILFGLLGMLCVLQSFKFDPVHIWPGLVLTTGFAVVDELLQLFFPHRSFSLIDLFANLIGILIFATATACYCRYKKELVASLKNN